GIATLYNPFAAMPSLHVAFAMFVCIGLFRVSRRWPLRIGGVLYAIAMTIAVIGTGNHYVLDCIAGATLAGCAWSLIPRVLVRAAEDPRPLPVPQEMASGHHVPN
ncbi:MAG: phosphatase PAP2 family protein, partial [Thermomicrobium sp.]|nr:phosphatase PAP2 family protein [Thermomicrobium sp.]